MKKLFTLLTMLVVAISTYAADPKYSATCTATGDVSFNAGRSEVTSNVTISGGKMYVNNGQTSAKNLLTKNGFCMTNNNTYFEVEVNNVLEVGDRITINYTGGTKNSDLKGLKLDSQSGSASANAITATSSSETAMGSALDYTVQAGDVLVGKKTFYIYRATGATQYFNNVVIESSTPSTDPIITASDASVAATESGVAATVEVPVTGANLTGSTLTATLANAPTGMSVSLDEDAISEGAISATATVSYTATENADGTATLTFSDGTTSKSVNITYVAKVVKTDLKSISGDTTWDFSKVTGTVDNGASGEAFDAENVYADIVGLTYAADFDSESLAFQGQYPGRGGFAQRGRLHFKTTIDGSVRVTFSNTGGSNKERYVTVTDANGEQVGTVEAVGTTHSDESFNVVAGDVYISSTPDALRYYSIEFTEAVAPVAVTGVTVDESASVEAGKTVALTATVLPEDATNKNVTWSSDDETVATVENGIVTGVAAGTANITVTTVDGNFSDVCVVTVTAVAPVTPAAAPIFKNHETKYIVDDDKICLDGTKTGAKVRIYAAPATYVRVNVAKNEMPAAPTLTSGTAIDNTSGDSNKESGNLFTTDDNTATYYVRAIAWDANKNPESANEVVFTILPGEYNVTLGQNGYSTFAGEANITVTGAAVCTAIVGGSSKVTLTECAANAVVAAGKGIVLKGTQGNAVTIKTTAADATVSSTGLEGVTSSTESINDNPYVLASNGTKTAFIKAGSYGNVNALMHKAYLDGNANSVSGYSIDVEFSEATAINGVSEAAQAQKANVKVIKNGKLYIGNYNVAGQQVK